MSSTGHLEKVAIIGATGHLGENVVSSLLKTGKHTVTAIARTDSKSTYPEGVHVARVDYNDEASMVTALKGQQYLFISLSVFAAPDVHDKILQAATIAGVPYVTPNIHGYDMTKSYLGDNSGFSYPDSRRQMIDSVKKLGFVPIIGVCGFWYEWSLAIGDGGYGIDIPNRKVTFFDDGKTKINTSTWGQCGRAFGALLSLPEQSASSDAPSLAKYKDHHFYFSSFRASQRDMLDSLNRVLGSSDADWNIRHVPSKEWFEGGLKAMKEGDRSGFGKALYGRLMYPTGEADYETSIGLDNETLGLPEEHIDVATKRVVDMINGGWKPW